MIVLPIAYFPPIPWFSSICQEETFLIEIHQHYKKQQYSSRMYIQAANGPLCLSIPVKRRGQKMPIKDKRISYQQDWQKQHWYSLTSAYRNSPYFQYYESELHNFYKKKPVFLIEFLEDTLQFLLAKLNLPAKYAFTEEYKSEEDYGEHQDLRMEFDKGLEELPSWFRQSSYPQVFGEFVPGLSCLDLLCNEGPAAMRVLRAGMLNPR